MQLSIRIPDDLADSLRSDAERRGLSVNELVRRLIDALVDPEAEDDPVLRLRARIRHAGLLEEARPLAGRRPSAARVGKARKAAGRGTSLAELVSKDRR